MLSAKAYWRTVRRLRTVLERLLHVDVDCWRDVEVSCCSFLFTIGGHALFDELEGPASDMMGAADGEAGSGSQEGHGWSASGISQHATSVTAVRKAFFCHRLFFTCSGRCGLGPRATARQRGRDMGGVLLGMHVLAVLGRRVPSFSFDSDDYPRKYVELGKFFSCLRQVYIN